MIKEFRLPDAGEGLTEAEIVSWKVRPGDSVAVNDVIVEIETAKALVELPCPFAGVVAELLVPEGITVPVGTPIIAVTTQDAAPDASPAATPDTGSESSGATDQAPPAAADQAPTTAQPARTPVLVGYGPRVAPTARRRRRSAPDTGSQPAPDVPAPAKAQPGAAQGPLVPEPSGAGMAAARPLAKPPVRKLARDLGVDLTEVAPSGPGGVITRDDVKAAAGREDGPAASPAQTREPVRGVRRLTAEAMVASAFTAPHVTEWVQVDVTRTVRLVRRLRGSPHFDGVRLTPLAVVALALLRAVRHHPGINASFDAAAGEAGEIVTKHYVNLGVAAATPRGLVVPVIRDADRMGLRELARAIATLAETARAGRTAPSEMTGGTITITNVGVFGVDGGTPIINPGEAAILAVGQVAERPWVHRGTVRPRWVTTLALSFDHRVVDGELGSTVLAETASVLHDPVLALL